MAKKKNLTATLLGYAEPLTQALPESFRETVRLRTFGLLQIPMLFFIGPSVEEISDEKVTVKVPLSRRTMNHWRSMYFGVLAAGADCACGLLAMRLIDQGPEQSSGQDSEQSSGGKVGLIFKDFHAEFLKRAEGDVHFHCDEGLKIRDAAKRARESGERVNLPVHVTATVPSRLGDEPVARFILTLSLKTK